MAVAIGLGVASLATGVIGSISGAQGAANSARAQYEQQRINQQWAEFEKQMALTQQRGVMGLQEFDRLFGNATLERESLEQMIYGKRAYREQSQYNTSQLVRAAKQAQARQQSTLSSRGAGRGGTAEAIQRQAQQDFENDLARIRVNDEYQLAAFENQRNQMLKQRNLRPTNQPPTYIPATPVQPPNTSGMMTGALLGSLASGLGGLAGVVGAYQTPSSPSSTATPTGGAMSTNPNIPAAVQQYGNLGLGFTGG